MADSTAIIPFEPSRAPSGTMNEEQQAFREAIIEAFEQAGIVGFGGDGGTIKRPEIIVDATRLWEDPNWPFEFPEEEILAARTSLRKLGQDKAFKVMHVQNPDAETDSEGKSECNLLIVDIDGLLIFHASAGNTDMVYRVVVEPYNADYYTYIQKAFANKSQQHRVRYVELGRGYTYAQALHDAEYGFHGKRNRTVKPFPTQKAWAEGAGVSETTLSRSIQLSQQPPEIIQLVEGEYITLDQLMQLLSIDPKEKRIEAAYKLAETNRKLEKPLDREKTREQARIAGGKIRPGYQWNQVVARVPARALLLPSADTLDLDVPTALAMMLRNIDVIVQHIDVVKIPKVLKTIQKALLDDDAQKIVGELEERLGLPALHPPQLEAGSEEGLSEEEVNEEISD